MPTGQEITASDCTPSMLGLPLAETVLPVSMPGRFWRHLRSLTGGYMMACHISKVLSKVGIMYKRSQTHLQRVKNTFNFSSISAVHMGTSSVGQCPP